MVKGFKKDGKFRPTDNKKNSPLKKIDVDEHPRISISYNGKTINSFNELRDKKSLDSNLKVISMKVHTLDNFDIKYHFNSEGKIIYEGGLRNALEKMGARKLTVREIGVLIDKDSNNTDVTNSEFYNNNKDASHDYAREKQNDHSQNFVPQTRDDYNFGFFDVNGRKFLSITSDDNDEDDGIYDLEFIDDQEGVGDVGFYPSRLIDPEITIEFQFGGKKHEIRMANERSGKFYDMETDGKFNMDSSAEKLILGDYNENLEKGIEKFVKK